MRTLLLAGSAFLIASAAGAQDSVRTQAVTIARDTPVTWYMGSVRDNRTVVYVITARAGQTMNISLITTMDANYFSVYAPGSDTPLFNGPANRDIGFSGPLPVNGDYQIKVFLAANQPRREETAVYSLAIRVTED